MKKLTLILMALVMAPTCAAGTLNFGVTDNWNGTCTITYYVSDGDLAPVAMGIDVEITSGNPVKNVTDLDEFFEVYMDAIYTALDPCSGPGIPYGFGTPIADPCGPGEISLPQSKFTICMAGLGGPTRPLTKSPKMGTKDDPVVVAVLHSDGESAGTITLNSKRGGVYDEKGDVMDPNGPTAPGNVLSLPFTISECYREADVSAGYAVCKPKCWCYPRQCHGDADGKRVGSSALGYRYVEANDICVVACAWRIREPKVGKPWPGICSVICDCPGGVIPGACADFDHNKVGSAALGYIYVEASDIGILSTYWRIREPKTGPGGVPVCTWTGGTVEISPFTGQPGVAYP